MVGASKSLRNKPFWAFIALAGCVAVVLVSASTNIRSSHNWGDDFAQYISQGRNIVQHRSQLDTGVIQNDWSALRQIPDAAPVGWPLLLAISYSIFGNDMYHFGVLVAVCAAALGVVAIGYYRRYWSWGFTLMLVGLTFFNPWFIDFKASILTDIPFTACILGVIYLYVRFEKRQWWSTVVMGLLAGYAVAIRPAGVALFAAIFAYSVFEIWRKKINVRKELQHRGSVILIGLAVSFLLNSVLFPTGIGSSYYGFWAKRVLQTSSTTSFSLKPETAPKASLMSRYLTTFTGEIRVFTQLVPSTGRPAMDLLMQNGFLLFIGLGLLIRLSRPRIVEFFVLIYFFMLIVLQIRPEQGFRYLLPLLPFTFEYVFVALRFVGESFDVVMRWVVGSLRSRAFQR